MESVLLDKLRATLYVEIEDFMEQIGQEVHRMRQAARRERDAGMQEVARLRAELAREVATMQKVQAAHRSRVVLDIGGVRHVTSVATLRSCPGTMLDAMFSGDHHHSIYNSIHCGI